MTIFDCSNHDADPEGLISKYVEFECHRLTRDHFNCDLVGGLQDRMKVLFWYLAGVSGHRGYSVALPLSADQIRFLNSPAPVAGASRAVTIALNNFVLANLPSHTNLLDASVLREAVYWWTQEKAPLLKLEGCLVTDEQTALLRQEVGQPLDYPLNEFLSIYHARHPALQALSLDSASNRLVYYAYMILKSYSEPYILRFLSPDIVRKVLKMRFEADSAFARILGKYALGGADAAAGENLRAIGEELQRWHRKQDRYKGKNGDSEREYGECFIAKRNLSAPVEEGVALIGPIRKTSGLGQATRLSYDVLLSCEAIAPTALAFDLDNPAPVGFATEQLINPYLNRRAINLIHLNAESVPLAFAFEQEGIFDSSYNIGFFFWELNMIPKCHRLALELLDEIWVSSEYNREIYSRFTDKPVINVGMAVEVLPDIATFDRTALDLDAGEFVFLTIFDSFSFVERKNPLGVVDAFRTAFPRGDEKVRLVIKTQNRTRVHDAHQVAIWKRIDDIIVADTRIMIVNETYSYHDLLALKKGCDCYVSLHRSEGWGFGMIEAMQLGTPVIATAYSGNMEFCTPETAYLVDYELLPVRESEYIFVERGSLWADPKLASAAAAMRAAVTNPAEALQKARAASALVKAHFSMEAISYRYGSRLSHVRKITS